MTWAVLSLTLDQVLGIFHQNSFYISSETLNNANAFWKCREWVTVLIHPNTRNTSVNGMGIENLPFISFMFILLRAFPASRRFLNWTKAKPRIFPSVCKCAKMLEAAGGEPTDLRRKLQQPRAARWPKSCQPASLQAKAYVPLLSVRCLGLKRAVQKESSALSQTVTCLLKLVLI